MTDGKPENVNQGSPNTLKDDQIVTERKLPRRSFLGATGALLAGAAALVTGLRAADQDTAPGKKESDPDQKKTKAAKTKKAANTKAKKEKEADPDKAKPPQ